MVSEEIEYIEPTQEHVGQAVEVRDCSGQEWREGELIAIIDHEYGFIVKYSGYAWGACCKYARIPRPKPQPVQETTTKPIDWTKPVRTKLTKWPVTLVTVKGRGDYPIIGYVGDNIDVCSWDLQGNKPGRGEDPDGLENVPQRIQREYWVNVYPEGSSGTHRTKKEADGAAGTERIACVKITIDCEEGEGL